MENFLTHFENTFEGIISKNKKSYDKEDFVKLGLDLEKYLFMKREKLEELFQLFAADNQVIFPGGVRVSERAIGENDVYIYLQVFKRVKKRA